MKIGLTEVIAVILVLSMLAPVASTARCVVFEELWARLDKESYSAYVHCIVASGEVLYVVGNRTAPEGIGFRHYLRVEMRDVATGILLGYWEEEIRVIRSSCALRGNTLYIAGTSQHPNPTRSAGFLIALSSNLVPLKKIVLDYGVESGVVAIEADSEKVYTVTYVRVDNGVKYWLEVRDPVELEVIKSTNLPYEGNEVRIDPVSRHLWLLGHSKTAVLSEDFNTLIVLNTGGYAVDFDEEGYAYIVKSEGLVKAGPSGSVIREVLEHDETGEFLDVCYMNGYIFVVNRVPKYIVTGYYSGYYYVKVYDRDLALRGFSPLRSAEGAEISLKPGKVICSGGVLYFAGWYQRGQFTGWAILALRPVESEDLASTITPYSDTQITELPITTSHAEPVTQPLQITLTLQATQADKLLKTPRYWWAGLAATLIVFVIIVGPLLFGRKRHETA